MVEDGVIVKAQEEYVLVTLRLWSSQDSGRNTRRQAPLHKPLLVRFANISSATASHLAKPSVECGNKYHTQQEVEGNEYLLNYSPHSHWIESLTLFSEKLPRRGLFHVRRSGTFTVMNNFTVLFHCAPFLSHRSPSMHSLLSSLGVFSLILLPSMQKENKPTNKNSLFRFASCSIHSAPSQVVLLFFISLFLIQCLSEKEKPSLRLIFNSKGEYKLGTMLMDYTDLDIMGQYI